MAKFLLPLSLSLPEFFWWENGICLGKLLGEKWAKCGNPPGWNKGKVSLRLQEQMVIEEELRREGRGEGAGRQAGTPGCRRWETFPWAPTRQTSDRAELAQAPRKVAGLWAQTDAKKNENQVYDRDQEQSKPREQCTRKLSAAQGGIRTLLPWVRASGGRCGPPGYICLRAQR